MTELPQTMFLLKSGSGFFIAATCVNSTKYWCVEPVVFVLEELEVQRELADLDCLGVDVHSVDIVEQDFSLLPERKEELCRRGLYNRLCELCWDFHYSRGHGKSVASQRRPAGISPLPARDVGEAHLRDLSGGLTRT